MNWFRFFLGTPRRLVVTLGVTAALAAIHLVAPGIIQQTFTGLLNELAPIFYFVLIIALVLFGFKIMLAPFFPSKGEKKKK